MEIKDYLRIIKRRWKEVFGITFLTVVVYLLYVKYTPTTSYYGTTQVLIQLTPLDFGIRTEEGVHIMAPPFESLPAVIKSYRVCNSASVMLKEKDSINKTALEINTGLTVKSGADRTIMITYADAKQEDVLPVLQRVCEAFFEYDQQTLRDSYTGAGEYLTRRRQELEKKRDACRSEMLTIEEKARRQSGRQGSSLPPDQQATLKAEQLMELERTVSELQIEEKQLQRQIKLTAPGEASKAPPLDPAFSGIPRTDDEPSRHILASPEQLGTRLAELKSNLASMKVRYTDEYPRVIEVKAEISAIERTLASMNVTSGGQSVSVLQAELRVLQDKRAFIEDMLDKEWATLAGLTDIGKQMAVVRNQIDAYDREIESLGNQMTNMELKENMIKQRGARLDKGDDGQCGPWPLKGNAAMALPLCIIIGLFLGIGAGYMFEHLSSTIKTSQDVKTYLNLATIATIPRFKEGKVSLLEAALKSPITEIYNKLAIFLEALALEQRSKVFLVTSTKAEEGKSTISANVGIAMAQSGERVLLIDSDLRKPQYHMIFGLDNSRGLSTVLSGEFEADQVLERISGSASSTKLDCFFQSTKIQNLKVMTAGPLPSNPVAMLRSERMLKMLEQLKTMFDVIILDSPPVTGVIDPVILGAICDTTILVVSEDNVTRREVTQVKHSLSQVNANIAGVIINKGSIHPEDYYYYYYHRYREGGYK
jgi:succinoglycan biosynthesis transport protein ExoP